MDTTIVEISSPQKQVSTVSLVVTLLLLLFSLAALSFAIGFGFGKIFTKQPKVSITRKLAVITDQKNGNSILSEPNDNYKIVFPSTWKATSKTGDIHGLLLQSDEGTIDLWLEVDQPITLSKEQKDAIEKTNQITLSVKKETAKATEYVYKTGGFLTKALLPAKSSHPKVSFLLKASGKSAYEIERTILQSLSFNK